MFDDKVAAAPGNSFSHVVVFDCELDKVAGLAEVAPNRDVVHPGTEGGVEELEPLVVNVVHERVAQEQVFEAEAGRYSAEVEQVSAKRARERKEVD
jgi:hypothetical protein